MQRGKYQVPGQGCLNRHFGGLSIANLAGKLLAEAIGGQAERFDMMATLPATRFPGGTRLRYPGMVLGTLYYALKDRL